MSGSNEIFKEEGRRCKFEMNVTYQQLIKQDQHASYLHNLYKKVIDNFLYFASYSCNDVDDQAHCQVLRADGFPTLETLSSRFGQEAVDALKQQIKLKLKSAIESFTRTANQMRAGVIDGAFHPLLCKIFSSFDKHCS